VYDDTIMIDNVSKFTIAISKYGQTRILELLWEENVISEIGNCLIVNIIRYGTIELCNSYLSIFQPSGVSLSNGYKIMESCARFDDNPEMLQFFLDEYKMDSFTCAGCILKSLEHDNWNITKYLIDKFNIQITESIKRFLCKYVSYKCLNGMLECQLLKYDDFHEKILEMPATHKNWERFIKVIFKWADKGIISDLDQKIADLRLMNPEYINKLETKFGIGAHQ
jgi:hypothetical protein